MTEAKDNRPQLQSYFPYVIPFLVFAGFTYLVPWFNMSRFLVYPAKTLSVLVLLVFFWPKIRSEIRLCWDMNAVMAGILVFAIWIGLEGYYPQLGTSSGFNPYEAGNSTYTMILIAFRLFGAVLVVPVIEELFWRSFALRFLMDSNFTRVALGSFSWFSFFAVSVAFGLEHYRWLPGILAGMIYALLLYQRKNLFSPILAHAVTNLLLGIHVIVNQAWTYW